MKSLLFDLSAQSIVDQIAECREVFLDAFARSADRSKDQIVEEASRIKLCQQFDVVRLKVSVA